MKKKEEAEEYYSKDFEWEQLRQEIETNPSLSYHYILSFNHHTHTQIDPPLSSSQDSQAWDSFHLRHFTGKFFKVLLLHQRNETKLNSPVIYFHLGHSFHVQLL